MVGEAKPNLGGGQLYISENVDPLHKVFYNIGVSFHNIHILAKTINSDMDAQ